MFFKKKISAKLSAFKEFYIFASKLLPATLVEHGRKSN